MEPAITTTLLLQFIEGTIDRQDLLQLQIELGRNPETRREYYELLALDHLLAEKYAGPQRVSPYTAPSDGSLGVRRFRILTFIKPILAISAAAAVAFVLSFGSSRKPFPVSLEASVDGRFRVNNAAGGNVLKVGQTLEVESGVVAVDLNPYTKAFAEGPARLRLTDKAGNVELLSGKAYFEVSPGGAGFQVHCPSGVIRDIGTKFGVEVKADGFVETRVMEGQVRITDVSGNVKTVDAGHGLGWGRKGESSVMFDPSPFIQTLPQHRVIFADDFSEPDGTLLEQKPADIGGKWEHRQYDLSANPGQKYTEVLNGMIDTSFDPRVIRSTCRRIEANGLRQNYIIRISTGMPQNMVDKSLKPEAWEKIGFYDPDGILKLSLVARSSSSHQWVIRDELTGEESAPSNLSALADQEVTLFYESTTGRTSLHRGFSANASGTEVTSLNSTPGMVIDALTVRNHEGGDLALDSISVDLIDYTAGNALKR